MAWPALCLMLAGVFLPCFAVTYHAESGGFNMEFPFTLQYDREDIWSNGTGSSIHYPELWKHGPQTFITNGFIYAGVIHISLS